MRKLYGLTTLLGLLSGCGAAGATTVVHDRPCVASAWPARITIVATACPSDNVCIPVADAVALGQWIRDAERYHRDLATCPLVKEVP